MVRHSASGRLLAVFIHGQTRQFLLFEYVVDCYRSYEGLAEDTLRTDLIATAYERIGGIVAL